MKVLIVVMSNFVSEKFLFQLHCVMINFPYNRCKILAKHPINERTRRGYDVVVNLDINRQYQIDLVNSKIKETPFELEERLEMFKKLNLSLQQ